MNLSLGLTHIRQMRIQQNQLFSCRDPSILGLGTGILNSIKSNGFVYSVAMLTMASSTVCIAPNLTVYSRVKSGKFGHQVNSDTHL